jgi:asparagine synthase (glutamine-hydrolysing)
MTPVLPKHTLGKPKWGFTVDPVEQYKKDLKAMAQEVLSPERVRAGGVFNPRFVSTILDARPGQNLRWHYFMLWQMIGLELWRELFTDNPGVA